MVLRYKGHTERVTATGTIVGPVEDPFGNTKVGLHLETVVDRTKFGLNWNAPLPKGGFMLANDVSLRNLIPAELGKGFGFFQSKPATAFSPVAVTPDELGAAWQGGRLHLDLESTWNGARAGLCNAGEEMTFHFGQLIAHLCKTRNARAGAIVGSGTVSNKDWARGYSCIAEKRAIETIEGGAPNAWSIAHRTPASKIHQANAPRTRGSGRRSMTRPSRTPPPTSRPPESMAPMRPGRRASVSPRAR